jgi:F-type H+-transporting ATPase subunit c
MKLLNLAALAIVVLFFCAVPAFAADGGTSYVLSGKGIAGGLGMGLTIIGAGIGFGKIGGSALDGMARQPEVAPRIQTAMIIIAAMLEGATLASVVLSYLVGNGGQF